MGGSTQAALSGEVRGQASMQANELNKLIYSNLNFLTNTAGSRFGSSWNKIPPEVSEGYDKIRSATKDSYENAAFSSAEASRYLARTSGQNISQGQISGAINRDALNLDQQRRMTMGQIDLEEANAAMTANNGFMRLMTGAGQTALGLASSYQSQALGAAGQTNSTSPWQSALSGAMSGASIGSAGGLGWGTAAGALVGGAAGYFGGR